MTDYSQTEKNKHLSSLQFLWVRDSGTVYLGSSGFAVSHEAAIKMLAMASVTWGLTGNGGGSTTKGAHSQSLASLCWLLAGNLNFLRTWTSHGPPHRTAWVFSHNGSWFLPDWVLQDRESRKLQPLLWLSLGSHITSCSPHPVDYKINPIQCVRKQHKGMNTRKWGSLGTILETDHHAKEQFSLAARKIFIY